MRTQRTKRTYVHHVLNVLTYSVITMGGVMYLKDRSPYLDSSAPSSESQNTIGVNLLGTYSTDRYLFENVFVYIT